MAFPRQGRRACPELRLDGEILTADIYALLGDREELLALGVGLGRFNPRLNCFEGCVVTKAVLRRLAALGGKYLWELEPGEGPEIDDDAPPEPSIH